jgi:integrase
MPIILIEPRPGKTPYYAGRGKHLGVRVDRSTKARTAAQARKVIRKWERDIESGVFAVKGTKTFAGAALRYMQQGGDPRPVGPLLEFFKETPVPAIDQDAIDDCALSLFPTQSAATRNREVYTPVSAILKGAGCEFKIRRPKGSRGETLMGWLWPEEAERLFAAADKISAEFGLLCRVLCYTGMRLSECLHGFTINGLRLSEGFAFVPKTKNGKPRPIHLPPHIVAALANHPRGLERPGETVFRYHKGGALYDMLKDAAKAAAVTLPRRSAFHIFRHTYGTWMRRYGGLDTRGLVGTGAWDSEQSAARYAHTVTSEDARRADLLPTGKTRNTR